jgi:hypothetical protein
MPNKDLSAATSDVDPDAQMILDTLVGKTVASAQIEETRIAISTTDGLTFFFYGFMGGSTPESGG